MAESGLVMSQSQLNALLMRKLTAALAVGLLCCIQRRVLSCVRQPRPIRYVTRINVHWCQQISMRARAQAHMHAHAHWNRLLQPGDICGNEHTAWWPS